MPGRELLTSQIFDAILENKIPSKISKFIVICQFNDVFTRRPYNVL